MLNMIIIPQHIGFLMNMQFSEFDAWISILRIDFATTTGTMPMNISDKGQVAYGGFGRRMLHGCIDPSQAGHFNTSRPRQDGRHFTDDIFKCIFFNENGCILIKFSLKYVHKGSIDNDPALVQIMACADQATSHYLNQ